MASGNRHRNDTKLRGIVRQSLTTTVMAVILFGIHSTARAVVSVEVSSTFVHVVTDGGGGGYEAFPDVTRLQDGRLMSVFYEGYSHISPPKASYPSGGRVMYATSSTEGASWSAPSLLYDTPLDDRDPSITQLPDGRLMSTYFNYAGGSLGAYFVQSAGIGAEWSTPQLLAPTPYFVSSPIRQLSTGRLIAPLYRLESGVGANGAVTYSDNNGVDWTDPINIPNPSGAILDAETDVIELNNGDLYAIQRSSHSPAQYSISTDKGETWSNSQLLDFVAHSPYLFRTEHEDMILLGYRAYNTLDGTGTGYTALRYSLDECQTWSEPIAIDPACVGAYPSMVSLNDGSVLVTYYEEGGGSNIRARTIQITGLPEPGSWILLGTGLIGLAGYAWRKRMAYN